MKSSMCCASGAPPAGPAVGQRSVAVGTGWRLAVARAAGGVQQRRRPLQAATPTQLGCSHAKAPGGMDWMLAKAPSGLIPWRA